MLARGSQAGDFLGRGVFQKNAQIGLYAVSVHWMTNVNVQLLIMGPSYIDLFHKYHRCRWPVSVVRLALRMIVSTDMTSVIFFKCK